MNRLTGPITKEVSNRGRCQDSDLLELTDWIRQAPSEIFMVNNDPEDVYNRLKPILAPGGWRSLTHRKAAMAECLRVLGCFESGWNWKEGVDTTNRTSMNYIMGQETGVFQVSFDSVRLDDAKNTGDDLYQCILKYCGTLDVHKFIDLMKTDHHFALEYCARLLRNNYTWDGPILRHEIDKWLDRDAVAQFEVMLS